MSGVSQDLSDILLDLYSANSARHVYECATDLPLDDLFFVGGRLQSLIRKAEMALVTYEQNHFFFDAYAIATLKARLHEAKEFRRYIVKRIRNGF